MRAIDVTGTRSTSARCSGPSTCVSCTITPSSRLRVRAATVISITSGGKPSSPHNAAAGAEGRSRVGPRSKARGHQVLVPGLRRPAHPVHADPHGLQATLAEPAPELLVGQHLAGLPRGHETVLGTSEEGDT